MPISNLSSRPPWAAADDETDDAEPPTQTLDEDAVYDLLGNERRRVCLKLLSRSEELWDVSELSEEVAAVVADASTSPEDIYNSVYISLCQNHLPKLDEVDLVEYDSEEKTVRVGTAFDDIGRYWLAEDRSSEPSRPVSGLTLAASGLTVVCLGVALFAVPSLTSLLVPAVLAVHLAVLAVEIGVRRAA